MPSQQHLHREYLLAYVARMWLALLRVPVSIAADVAGAVVVASQLFTTWPVTPQGPWPSPQPFPSAIPVRRAQEASESESESESDSELDVMKLRMKKFVMLLSYLEWSGQLDIEAGGAQEQPAGLYGLAKSVLRVAVTGKLLDSKNQLGDPCGLNITCIINRVFDQHLPLSGA